MKKVKVEIEIYLEMEICDSDKPEQEMGKEHILNAIWNACRGSGDPREGTSMLADMGYAFQVQLSENLENNGYKVNNKSVGLQVKDSKWYKEKKNG